MLTLSFVVIWVLSPLFAYLLLKKERSIREENIRSLAVGDRDKQIEIFKYNGYTVRVDADKLFVARKEFSLGKLLIGYFFFGVGIFVYIVYFLFFEKPKEIDVNAVLGEKTARSD